MEYKWIESKPNIKGYLTNILILVGIPASGKSTFSKKFIEDNPNYIRINRDDIRKMIKNMLFLDYSLEKLVTDIEYSIAEVAIKNGNNVVWDNTHLSLKYINPIIEKFKDNCDITFKIFDIELDEARRRDIERENSVGEEVLIKMYNNLIKSKEFINLIQK